MTLVERLRGFYRGDMGEPADPINPDGPEAADRIEQLEAALRLFLRLMNDPDYDFGELCEEFIPTALAALESKS